MDFWSYYAANTKHITILYSLERQLALTLAGL